ncbi:hypothetical protein [Paenibacillus lactis]|uniref:hypothetical protein n=1 Tax=Paenibacillus lactis TaxID=228574 RepID=UPI003D732257
MDYRKVIDNLHYLIEHEQNSYKNKELKEQMEIHQKVIKLLEIQLEVYKQGVNSGNDNTTATQLFNVITSHWNTYNEEQKRVFSKFLSEYKRQ